MYTKLLITVVNCQATYFGRDDIALPGFSKRFKEASQEETEHADKLIDYQTMRGGKVVFRDISRPNRDEWGTALEVGLDLKENEH